LSFIKVTDGENGGPLLQDDFFVLKATMFFALSGEDALRLRLAGTTDLSTGALLPGAALSEAANATFTIRISCVLSALSNRPFMI
jgi:hypothetical protein